MRAALGVEVDGEIIYKDGRRIQITGRDIPKNIQLLVNLLLSEKFEDIYQTAYSHEALILTYYKIFNLQ